jgi:putative aminopeptidase FrvX
MLKELSELIGVSGGEERVRSYIKDVLVPYCDEMIEDAYGNLIVRRGKADKPRILLAAHMDEVGFIITAIEKSGFLRFQPIGLIPHVLLAKRVVIGKNNTPGVIVTKPIHLMKKEEKDRLVTKDEYFMDIGVSSKEEASASIEVGDLATFDTPYSEKNGILYGKAFDDRIGCYILIQILKNTDFPLYCAFTTQEEAGLRGARIVGFRVSPDIALAIDTTASGEWPVEKDEAAYPEIGKGPVISIADRSIICDRELVSLLRETAESHGISYQDKKPMIGGTDAGSIHVAKAGVRSAVLQTAARYIHSPLSIVARDDIDAGIRLLTLSLESIFEKESLWN